MLLLKVPRLLLRSINTPASALTSNAGRGWGARVIASGQALGLGESRGWAEMRQAFLICPFGGRATAQADSSKRHSQSSGPQAEQVGGGLSLRCGW